MNAHQKYLLNIACFLVITVLPVVQLFAQPAVFENEAADYNYSFPVLKPDGVVFTINNTDKRTGKSLGSTKVFVQGIFLKVTSQDGEFQSLDHASEMIISNSAVDASSANANASASVSDDASVFTNTNTSDNANDGEMIYNADRREMVVVDHENKEYFVMDEAFLATMKDNFGDVAEQMSEVSGMMQQAYEAALAQLDAQGLSPQERAAAEQMLRNTFGAPAAGGPAKLEINSLGENTIIGYPTINYELLLGGEKTKELWVADWKDLGAGAKAQQTFESYFNFFAEMSNGYEEIGFGSDGDFNFFQTMDQIGGFPVFGQYFEGGEVDEEFSLDSVIERDLDPDAFEPPSGYSLRTMGGFFESK